MKRTTTKKAKPQTTASRIATARRYRELTRETLAFAWGVSVSTVRNWEIGLSEPRDAERAMVERWLDGGTR